MPEPAHEEHGPKDVQILVNGRAVLVPGITTGAEIKQRAGQPAEFDLFRVEGDHEIAITDDERIHVHKGERFIACPGLEPA